MSNLGKQTIVSGSNSLYAGLESGLFDSSGVRFYVSDQLRENEVGVLQLGGKSQFFWMLLFLGYPRDSACCHTCFVVLTDPFVILFGEPVGGGLSRHTFECPGSCSQLALIDEPVTVLREYLHMHQAGKETNQLYLKARILDRAET